MLETLKRRVTRFLVLLKFFSLREVLKLYRQQKLFTALGRSHDPYYGFSFSGYTHLDVLYSGR